MAKEETKKTEPAKVIQPLPIWAEALEECFKKLNYLTSNEKALKEINYAKKIIEGNAKLQKCTKESIISSIENCVKAGLSLAPILNLAYLSCDAENNQICTLDVSYLGLIKILKDTKAIKHIDAYVVYDDELLQFKEDRVTGVIYHTPIYVKTEEEQKQRNIYGVYCRILLSDNTVIFPPFLPVWEIDKIRRTSKSQVAGANNPWEMWKEEMYKKTGIRRCFKTLIQGEIDERVTTVLEIEQNSHGLQEKYLTQGTGKGGKKSLTEMFS